MKRLFKSLICILLIFVLSLSIVSATDGDGSGGGFLLNFVIKEVLIK